jgi:hypothetical protein
MIGSIKNENNFIHIFDVNGVEKAMIGLPSDQTLKGFSNTMIVAMAGGFVTVYDENGHQKAFFGVSSLEEFFAVIWRHYPIQGRGSYTGL